jgi:hypothetical protein
MMAGMAELDGDLGFILLMVTLKALDGLATEEAGSSRLLPRGREQDGRQWAHG